MNLGICFSSFTAAVGRAGLWLSKTTRENGQTGHKCHDEQVKWGQGDHLITGTKKWVCIWKRKQKGLLTSTQKRNPTWTAMVNLVCHLGEAMVPSFGPDTAVQIFLDMINT